MKQTRPFQAQISEKDKLDLETLAMSDGCKRGIFFDTSGKLRKERVSDTSQHTFIYKTISGVPFKWIIQ